MKKLECYNQIKIIMFVSLDTSSNGFERENIYLSPYKIFSLLYIAICYQETKFSKTATI